MAVTAPESVGNGAPHQHADPLLDRKFPPVTEIGMASLALIVIGGIYLSSHLPQHVPLGPAIGLLIASACLLALNLVLLSRVKDFAWPRFFSVARWSLVAYAIIGAMIAYAFVRNHVSGGPLVVLLLSLAVFAVHVPMLVGFTVARYYRPEEDAAMTGLGPHA
jgi:drug/metabolite transporter (DMT)-like permease